MRHVYTRAVLCASPACHTYTMPLSARCRHKRRSASRSSGLCVHGRLWDPETGALLAALALSSLPAALEGAGAHAADGVDGAAAETGGALPHAGGAAEPEAAYEAGMPDPAATDETVRLEPDGGLSGNAGEPEAAKGELGADTGAECGAAAFAGLGGARSEAKAGTGDTDGVLEGELAEEPRHYPRVQLPPAVLAVAVAPDGCAPRAQDFAPIRHPCQVPPESVFRTLAFTLTWHPALCVHPMHSTCSIAEQGCTEGLGVA